MLVRIGLYSTKCAAYVNCYSKLAGKIMLWIVVYCGFFGQGVID